MDADDMAPAAWAADCAVATATRPAGISEAARAARGAKADASVPEALTATPDSLATEALLAELS